MKRKPGNPLLSNMRKQYDLYLMVLPAVALIILFNYIPMYGIQLAFREFNPLKGLTGGAFVGLKYLQKFTSSFLFWSLLENTVRLSLTTLIVGFPVPILLALVINQIGNAGIRRPFQTTVYLPHFISTVVMVGMLRILLSPSTGIIGSLLAGLGVKENLIGDPGMFVPVYVISQVWQHMGWDSIIYLAALTTIDTQLYDAVKIDGASRLQTIWYIDLPSLTPTIVILFIINMGGILGVGFEKAFLMQNSLNISVSEIISTYVYKIGILSNQYSYSAAIGLFNTLINFCFVFAANSLCKRFSDISLW